jgi:neutral ceramidase
MDQSALSAAAARRTITPPKGIYLIGYGDRVKGNQGAHDPLTATALALADGQRSIAIVACDLLCLNEYVIDRVRESCGSGVEVLVCCSHTHSGPIGYAGAESPRANRGYIAFLVEQITAAVKEAVARLRPARLAWSSAQAAIAVNRRERKADGSLVIGENPDGAVDRSVQVLSVVGLDGERIATLVNFACHGTVWGPDNLLVSADWIGVMRDRIEADLGGLGLFLQGAAANLNPHMGWDREYCAEMVAQQGEEVAAEVVRACRAEMVDLLPVPLYLQRKEVWLPFDAPAETSTLPKTYRRRLLAMAHLPGWMGFLTDLLLERRYPWRSRLEARDGFWATPLRLSLLRAGDFCLAGLGAEVFTEIGLEVKRAAPSRCTMVVTYTDGCVGYLPTAQAHAEGGYEVDTAPFAYRYPGAFSAQCESIVEEQIQAGLKRLQLLIDAAHRPLSMQ